MPRLLHRGDGIGNPPQGPRRISAPRRKGQPRVTAPLVFRRCVEAIRDGVLVVRENARDKEFHFQNWFEARLRETGLNYEVGRRNSYPDFTIVQETDGYELKGLAYPGRDASFDSNSQAPTGFPNGRSIHYVFGRYPANPDGNSFPVLDLVICHGDFLNADHVYIHQNKSVRGFASYGDILIRDRKMYVVPTPFRLIDGVAHQQTLILPSEAQPDEHYFEVGALTRIEADELIISYTFSLKTNDIFAEKMPNPDAGLEHKFRAWRLKGAPQQPVSMRILGTDVLDDPGTDEEVSAE